MVNSSHHDREGRYRHYPTHEPSPVVELNRAVAVGMAEGVERGLELLDRPEFDTGLNDYHLYHAARADLMRRAERKAEAAEAYHGHWRSCPTTSSAAIWSEG